MDFKNFTGGCICKSFHRERLILHRGTLQSIFLQKFESDRGCWNFDRASPLVKFSTGAIPAGLFFFTGVEAGGALGRDVFGTGGTIFAVSRPYISGGWICIFAVFTVSLSLKYSSNFERPDLQMVRSGYLPSILGILRLFHQFHRVNFVENTNVVRNTLKLRFEILIGSFRRCKERSLL